MVLSSDNIARFPACGKFSLLKYVCARARVSKNFVHIGTVLRNIVKTKYENTGYRKGSDAGMPPLTFMNFSGDNVFKRSADGTNLVNLMKNMKFDISKLKQPGGLKLCDS